MRILIETVGSAGDVHPFVAVGRALVARGHDVTLFSRAGLPFAPTSTAGNYDEITGDPDLWHPTRGPVVVLGNTVRHLLAPTVDAILAAGAGPGTVVVSPTLGFAGSAWRSAWRRPSCSRRRSGRFTTRPGCPASGCRTAHPRGGSASSTGSPTSSWTASCARS